MDDNLAPLPVKNSIRNKDKEKKPAQMGGFCFEVFFISVEEDIQL